jgi:hypothetical protein
VLSPKSYVSELIENVAEIYYLASNLTAGFGFNSYLVTGRDMM